MKVNNFSAFMRTRKVNENSDLDWSDKNWDERGQTGENPPNSGLEGTSAEPRDFFGGNADGFDDEILIDDEERSATKKKRKSDATSIREMIKGLAKRIEKLENKKSKG